MSINSRIVLVHFFTTRTKYLGLGSFIKARSLFSTVLQVQGDQLSYCEDLRVHGIAMEKVKGPIRESGSEFKKTKQNNKNWLF